MSQTPPSTLPGLLATGLPLPPSASCHGNWHSVRCGCHMFRTARLHQLGPKFRDQVSACRDRPLGTPHLPPSSHHHLYHHRPHPCCGVVLVRAIIPRFRSIQDEPFLHWHQKPTRLQCFLHCLLQQSPSWATREVVRCLDRTHTLRFTVPAGGRRGRPLQPVETPPYIAG